MDIQDLGAIGEILAAVATLSTLIYLALQIKHNTNAVAGGNELAINKEITDWHSRVTSDPELMILYDKGASNESMTAEQAMRYRWLMAEIIWFYEGVFRLHRRGLVSDEQWESIVIIMMGILQSDVLREWWDARTPALSDQFVECINERLLAGEKGRWRQSQFRLSPKKIRRKRRIQRARALFVTLARYDSHDVYSTKSRLNISQVSPFVAQFRSVNANHTVAKFLVAVS
jgi:hypothetical protein